MLRVFFSEAQLADIHCTMDEFAIDLDKVLDEFEETEGILSIFYCMLDCIC